MSTTTLQIFENKQLVNQIVLNGSGEYIAAADNMEFRLVDSVTKEPVAADYVVQTGEDLVVFIGQEEIILEDYFAVENATLTNTTVNNLGGEKILASEITAPEAGAATNVTSSVTPNIATNTTLNTTSNSATGFAPFMLGLGALGLTSAAIKHAKKEDSDDVPTNKAPTNIGLDNNTVIDNIKGAVVGRLNTTDTDSNQFVYHISDSRFEVVDGRLKLKDSEQLDRTKESSVKLKVTSTDESNLSFTKEFIINVSAHTDDITPKQAPTDITLSNNKVFENATGVVIGELNTTDPDSSDFTYQVSDKRFAVVDGKLKLKSGQRLDFERESSVNVIVTATDETNLSLSKGFTIRVTDVNDNQAPNNITLSSNSVVENKAGALIGKLTTTDVDSTQFTYRVSDKRFEVVDGQLKLKAGEQLDFEKEPTLNIKVTSTDETDLSFSKVFTIKVGDVDENINHQPTDVKLHVNSISENNKGAVIGTLSTIDVDKNDTFTYTLNSHTDKFEIVNGQLKLLDDVVLDYEKNNTLTVNITSSDGKKSISKNITIQVVDQDETAPDISTTPYFIHSLWEPKPHHHAHTPSGWDGVGEPRHIVYSFASSKPAGSVYTGFVPYTAEQQNSVRKALAIYAKQFSLTFDEVAMGSQPADVVFYRANLNNKEMTGVTNLSWSNDPNDNIKTSNDIHMNVAAYNNSDDMQPGSYAFLTLLHEIGHAVGLKHPGNYDGQEPGPFLPEAEDKMDNTVISYNYGDSVKESLGMFDVAALEYMYGVNSSFNRGDNTYAFNTASHYISDGSGIDTLNASSQTADLTIDLTSGSWNYADSKSDSILADGQLFIGYDTLLENINAGSGNDTLTGNHLANNINGGAGNDRIAGGLGVDTLNGEAGNDVLTYDISDYINGGLGKDTLKITGTDDIQPGEFSRVKNVEVLDLTDSQSQQVTLSAEDVLDMTDSNHTLRVNGGSNDKVTLDGFNKGETEANYTQYTHSGATLWVDDDITPTLIA